MAFQACGFMEEAKGMRSSRCRPAPGGPGPCLILSCCRLFLSQQELHLLLTLLTVEPAGGSTRRAVAAAGSDARES